MFPFQYLLRLLYQLKRSWFVVLVFNLGSYATQARRAQKSKAKEPMVVDFGVDFKKRVFFLITS